MEENELRSNSSTIISAWAFFLCIISFVLVALIVSLAGITSLTLSLPALSPFQLQYWTLLLFANTITVQYFNEPVMRNTVKIYMVPVAMTVCLEATEEGMICETCSAVAFEPKPLSPATPVIYLKLPLINPEKFSHVPSSSIHAMVIKSCIHLNMFILELQRPSSSFPQSIFFSYCLLGPNISHFFASMATLISLLLSCGFIYFCGRLGDKTVMLITRPSR